MKSVATIFAVLLLLLGGGCTLLFVFVGIPLVRALGGSGGEDIPLWLFLGLLPLVVGTLILLSQKRSRASSTVADLHANTRKPEEPPGPPDRGEGP